MSPLKTQKQGLRTKMQIAALSLVLAAGHICAQERNYDIQPQPLSQALRDYARASGVQIIFTEDLVRGRTAPPLQGEFTAEEALNRLLDGSGLRADRTPAGAVMIARIGDDVQAPDNDGQDQAPAAATDSGPDTYEFDIPSQDLVGALRAFSRTTGREMVFDRAVVRGKISARLQGAYTADEGIRILLTDADLTVRRDQQGRFRVEEAVRVPDVPREPEPVAELERVAVTGTHIRGIAPDSSPTRIYTREDIQNTGLGTLKDFIRTLPQNFGGGSDESFVAAPPGNNQAGGNNSSGTGVNLRGLGTGSTLVLLNGRRVAPSSNIGGFVDISMIPASAIERVEVVSDGASSIYGGDAVAGVVNVVLRDEYDEAEASLRFGTVTEGDLNEYRASLTGGKNWGSGSGLIVYEYYQRDNLDNSDRSFSKDFVSPNDLLPRQERHSVLGSLSQQLAPNLEFGGDILYTRREPKRLRTLIGGPNEGLTTETNLSTENLNVGANLAWEVARDWVIDIAGNYSTLSTDSDTERTDGQATFSHSDSDYWAIETKASGTVIDLPGGAAKLAVGGHYRKETFLNSFVRRPDGAVSNERDGDREVFAFFGEVFLPIIGPDNALPGVRRLEINASGRFEDYSDFGSEANPKVGLLWAPTDRLRLRGSYSTSFKPPTVGQTGALDRGATAIPTSLILAVFGAEPSDPSIADVDGLFVFGTGDNLDAETARTFSGGFDYDVASGRHNISLSASYFDIVFEDRLGETPVPGGIDSLLSFNIAFDSPELFPEGSHIFFPSQDELNAVLNSLHQPVESLFGADPSDAAFISFVVVTRNLSRTEVRGVDFDAAYSFDGDFGSLILGLDATYLGDFTQQAAATTPTVQLLDTQFNPLDLKLRGRIGYDHNGFNANLFVNYADDYRVTNTETAAKIDSWTTVDLSLSFDTRERYNSPLLDNTVFRFSVVNLLDEDPPEAPALTGITILNFDPTNASPLGRFIAFEITKRF